MARMRAGISSADTSSLWVAETVVFGWIAWPSRQARDEGMQNAMADPRLQADRNPMPFDGKRMIYGGFDVLLEA